MPSNFQADKTTEEKEKEKREKEKEQTEMRGKADSTKIAPAPQSINTYICIVVRAEWETVSYNNQLKWLSIRLLFLFCSC